MKAAISLPCSKTVLITMKVSTTTSSLLLSLLSLVAMTTADAAAVAQAPLGAVDEAEAVYGSDHQFGLLRMTVNDLKKGQLAAKHLAFSTQALKRAFNTIHAEINDDIFFVDSNITAIELQKEKRKHRGGGLSSASTTLERIFGGTYFEESFDDEKDESDFVSGSYADWVRKQVKWRGSFYNQFDVTCYLCKNDDDSLELSSTLGGGNDAKWSHPQAIADLYCKILKAEGDKAVFGAVKGCQFFPVSSLGEWEIATAPSSTTTTAAAAAADNSNHVAISLGGLDCAEEPEACNGKELRQLVSDAFTLAYNQVYFHDYNLQDFAPASFVLYEDTTEQASVGSALRGGGTDPMDTAERLPVGIWRGSIHVEDRFMDEEEATHPKKNPLAALDQVEEIFCGLMANFGGVKKDNENQDAENQNTAILSTWETCSIASFVLVNPVEYRNLVVDMVEAE